MGGWKQGVFNLLRIWFSQIQWNLDQGVQFHQKKAEEGFLWRELFSEIQEDFTWLEPSELAPVKGNEKTPQIPLYLAVWAKYMEFYSFNERFRWKDDKIPYKMKSKERISIL